MKAFYDGEEAKVPTSYLNSKPYRSMEHQNWHAAISSPKLVERFKLMIYRFIEKKKKKQVRGPSKTKLIKCADAYYSLLAKKMKFLQYYKKKFNKYVILCSVCA